MPEPAGSGPGGLLAVTAYERFRTTVTVEDLHAPQPH